MSYGQKEEFNSIKIKVQILAIQKVAVQVKASLKSKN